MQVGFISVILGLLTGKLIYSMSGTHGGVLDGRSRAPRGYRHKDIGCMWNFGKLHDEGLDPLL